MKRSTIKILVVTVLVLCGSVVCAQQSVDETKVAQMRVTVQKLEGLVGDANIPAETREQLNDLLFEKRGELHALLRQKRDTLRSSLRGSTSADELNSVNNTIRQLNQEMQQLKGARTTASVPDQGEELQGGGRNDSESPSNGNANTSTTRVRTPPAPTASTPTATTPATSTPRATTPAATTPALTAPATTAPGSPTNVTSAVGPAATDPACVDPPPGPVSQAVEYQRQIRATACRIFEAKTGVPGTAATDAKLTTQAYNFIVALTIARAKLPKVAIPELTAQAENASHAKNLTAGESSSGGTSLVAKAGVPAILGFAAENGGLTRTTSGTTVTFTGNPVGLVQAMAKKGFISSFQEQDDFTKVLRKFSFGLSFDTSRGTQSGTFTGDKQQLSGFSFKYNIVDQRDPRSEIHTNRWLELTSKQATNLAGSVNKFVDDIVNDRMPGITAWIASANVPLTTANTVMDIENVLKAQLKVLETLPLTADQEAVIKQVGADFDALIEKRNDILDEISNGWVATLDYNNTRPVGTPSLSNFRFLAEKGAYKGSIDFTGNASLTFYNSRPTGPKAQTLRDFRFAGQLDVPIGDVTKTGKFLISLAGRYERLLEDEKILGSTVVIPKGDIAAFQAKLTIPIRGTALKIPLSFTYANRTELIKEKDIRGNFGLTFDLDSLFAKFNPFTKE